MATRTKDSRGSFRRMRATMRLTRAVDERTTLRTAAVNRLTRAAVEGELTRNPENARLLLADPAIANVLSPADKVTLKAEADDRLERNRRDAETRAAAQEESLRHRLAGIEDDILAGRKVSPERFGAGGLPSAGDDVVGTLAQSEGGKVPAQGAADARDFSSLITKAHLASSAELDGVIAEQVARHHSDSAPPIPGSRPRSSMVPINDGYEVGGDSGHPSNVADRPSSVPNINRGAIVYEEPRRPTTERLLLAEHVGENKIMPVDGFGYIPTRDPKREALTEDGYFDGTFANRPDDAVRHDKDGNPKTHAGIDAPADKGTPVRAAAGGIVHFYPAVPKPKPYWEFGNWAIVEHPNGEFTVYAHLDTLSEGLKKGPIPAGTVIGTVGSTGNAGKPHLHFEVWRGGIDTRGRYPMPPKGERAQYRVNPYLWLQEDQWLPTNNDKLNHRRQQ